MTPPVLLRAGLDIGGTKVDGVVLAADGTVLARARVPTPAGVADLVDVAGTLVESLAAGCGGAGVASVGVGVPGVVDRAAGTVGDAVNLGVGGRSVALGPLLSTRLGGVPVALENDVNASALGIRALLLPDGDLVLLSLGTGLAAGIVLDGVPRRGATGAAGEIGHLSVDAAGPPCPCGQRGCLETVASGAALTRRWHEVHAQGEGDQAGDVWTAAAAGDAAAVAVRDEWAAAVALAVRVLVLADDPRHVVLGGGVASVGEPLLAAVSAALQRQAVPSGFLRRLAVHERLSVVPAGLPVAAVGAASVLDAEGGFERRGTLPLR